MRPGDLVRVKKPLLKTRPSWVSAEQFRACSEFEIGILISYQTWEKVATVLLRTGVRRVRAEYVEKAGKKDDLI